MTVEGGSFAGDHADVYYYGGTNANGRNTAINIKGGTYKFKPTAVATGYKAVQQNDGTWVVVEE